MLFACPNGTNLAKSHTLTYKKLDEAIWLLMVTENLGLPRFYVLVTVLIFVFLNAHVVLGQDGAQPVADSPRTNVIPLEEELIVVGSRVRGRNENKSLVPIDIVPGDDFIAQGASDLDSIVAALVPSYNVALEPISDAATIMRPASLRGMSPDSMLVLLNGKRRHRGAVVILGSGLAAGSQAPDLSSIPGIAIDRLEVLRDGASAQYGSNAIAGIMNFVLKRDRQGGLFEAKLGSTFKGDGQRVKFAGNIGLPLGHRGFANLSGEFKAVDPTDRAVQRSDAQDLIDAGNNMVRTPHVMVWGSPEIRDDMKLFGNFGLDLAPHMEAYGWINHSIRTVKGGFYFRNPNTRNGVFNGASNVYFDPATRIVVAPGTPGAEMWDETVRVANLDSTQGGCGIDTIQDPFSLVSYAQQNASANYSALISGLPSHCFMFQEVQPGGFTPQFGGDVTDQSLAIGVKGITGDVWYWDVSYVHGMSEAIYFIQNTVNPQIWAKLYDAGQDPTTVQLAYHPGTYVETDTVFNFDVSRQLDVARFYGYLNIAAGFESRSEQFEIIQGEPNSWYIDPSPDGLTRQGFGIGSNGFPGFPASDAGERTVEAWGAYLDLEGDATESMKLGVAVRYDDYDAFGTTFDWKFTGRMQINDIFSVRGAYSTGFRTPTAGQSNLRNVTTEFTDGKLADIATLPPTNPVAQQKGAVPLKPEESTNTTLGSIWAFGWGDVTLDYYKIKTEGRIAFTSRFTLTEEDIDTLIGVGVPDASSFTSVRYFTNQQDAHVSGVDLVLSVPFEFYGGRSKILVSGNWNSVELVKFNPAFTSLHLKSMIEDGSPSNRITATWTHGYDDWSGFLRVQRYGTHYDAPLNEPDLSYRPDPGWLVSLEITRHITDTLTVVAGLENVFDYYPTENPHAPVDSRGAGGAGGLIYPEQSPYGFLGGAYYVRFQYRM